MVGESFGELDDIGFLAEAELFRDMPEAVIRTIVLQAETAHFSADAHVVRKGDPGDSLFVVKTGVVEVTNPQDGTAIAYMGRGECFGELALLTESPRTADVRVPQHAELLVIDRPLFNDLMENHAGFAKQLSIILANRLVRANENRSSEESGQKELQGSLEYFDLATMVQTLISSSQTGIMTLSFSGETVAQLFFQSGNVFRAHYGHRRGDEAVHHLFQKEPGGEFRFESGGIEAVEDGPDPGITVPAMALMMDSVRLQDELKVLLEDLPSPGTVIARNADDLVWSEDEGQAEARQIWGCLHAPLAVTELMERAHSCYYHTARILTQLLQTEQIKPSTAEGTEEE